MNGQHFNVFTEPLEMHRYFEQQMDEVFRTFGFPNFRNFYHQTPDLDGHVNEKDLKEKPKHLRDKFLKNDYVKPHYEESNEKVDKNLDGKLKLGHLDSPFGDSSNKHSLDIYKKPITSEGTFFGQSVQVKTIRKPDGSLQTYRTARDSQGNTETTITQKVGDKEYTIIKKLDQHGKEETQEIMKNMNETDKTLFTKFDHNENKESLGAYFNDFFFNKFFR